MNTEEIKTLNKFIKKLSNYGTCSYEVSPDLSTTPFPAFINITPHLIVTQWYANQKAMSECLNLDYFHQLSQSIGKYYQRDNQFPPDLLKCCRLYGILKIYNPDCIVELGCGTSSLIISHYLNIEPRNIETKFVCIDKDAKWLKLTQEKIAMVIPKPIDNMFYFHHKDNAKTIDFVKEATSAKRKIFIYLDARILKNEKKDGMDLVLQALSGLEDEQEVMLLIDARIKAVCSLLDLAKALNKTFAVTSNCLYPEEQENVNGAVHRYQHMGSFSIVRSK